MSSFRSETMGLYQLIVPRESSYDLMDQLGHLDSISFINSDPTPISQRPFANYLKRCEQLLVKVNYLLKELAKLKINDDVIDFKSVLLYFETFQKQRQLIAKHQFLNEVEDYINQKWNFFNEQNETLHRLTERKVNLKELLQSLSAAERWLGMRMFKHGGSVELDDEGEVAAQSAGVGSMVPQSVFTYYIGIIETSCFQIFQKAIFRITKGNFDMQTEKIEESQQKNKICFLLIFPSRSQQSQVNVKIKRICDACQVTRLPIPKSQDQWSQKYLEYSREIDEVEKLSKLTMELVSQALPPLASNLKFPSLQYLRLFLVREKHLYENLNCMRMQQSLFICKVWVREKLKEQLNQSLNYLKCNQPNLPVAQFQPYSSNKNRTPPTYFQTNTFTSMFQQLVYTYGVPKYKEINPTGFTIVTYPFFFAVMFGDIAHGICLVAIGLSILISRKYSPKVLNQKLKERMFNEHRRKLQQEEEDDEVIVHQTSSWIIVWELRYLIILCGLLSIYVGFIYNEFAGFKQNFFGSKFGFDAKFSQNLNFCNSVKMKLSIIIGFIQMTLGILISGANAIYFGKWVELIIIFPAKLIFFVVTIGYMVLLIIIKWLTSWTDTSQAPSIINTIVSMWLEFGKYGDNPMWGDGSSQETLQTALVSIGIICLPLMFLPIIFYDYAKLKERKPPRKRKSSLIRKNIQAVQEFELVQQQERVEQKRDSSEELIEKEEESDDNDEFSSIGDIWVHHGIETIEFVLGCISNTASYLRLWALSLAHQQLAEVFYELTVSQGVESGNFFAVIAYFPIYAVVTIGVLLLMDAMECFLHSLRLHWFILIK